MWPVMFNETSVCFRSQRILRGDGVYQGDAVPGATARVGGDLLGEQHDGRVGRALALPHPVRQARWWALGEPLASRVV